MRNEALKVVHIVEGFVGGLSTYICTVLPQLAQKGFKVTLICSLKRCCPDALSRIEKLRQNRVTVHIISMQREISPLKDLGSFAVLLRLLLKEEFDIVHTHCSKAGVLGRIAAALAGKRIRLHSPHCFAFMRSRNQFKTAFYSALERLLGRLTTKLVAVSQSEADVAVHSHIVARNKCVTVKNGLTCGKYSPDTTSLANELGNKASFGIHEDTRVVTTACRLVDYKGIFRFLKAAQLSRTDNTLFMIAGQGKLSTPVERFINQNRLDQKVRLLGYVSDMQRLYAISDIVALCSDAEAQPYLLIEAMKAKCPIVATSVIGNNDLISQGKTGLLVSPEPASIAMAIDELLTNRDKANEYATNAYAYVCKHHTLENQVSKLAEIYKSCVYAMHRHYQEKLSTEYSRRA